MIPQPQRIQRKRVKGYNMQAESMALNGLPAKSCTRPHKFGNPYEPDQNHTVEDALNAFEYLTNNPQEDVPYPSKEVIKRELAGFNLACFCKLSDKCHVDTLLKIANS